MSCSIEACIFDLDGTIYLGNIALPGAVEGIAELRNRGKRTLFISNKPLETRDAYARKLTRLGIPASPEDVITSGFVLGYYLAQTEPYLRLYVVGEANLLEELRSHGLHIVPEFVDQDPMQVITPEGVDAIVVAFDRTLNYRKLNTAYQALRRGARFFATNPDKTCPMPGGAIPDAGGTIAALEHMTGRKVELLAGKPSKLMIDVALQKLNLPPERVLLVGDRLETDVYMGKLAGMFTAVTLTGVSTRSDVEKMPSPPDFVINSLAELVDLIG